MWICTSEGFLSIVDKAPTSSTELLVRARTHEHLAAHFPDATIIEKDGTDYRFRAIVSRSDVAQMMAGLAYSIDYSNFKDTVKERKYHDALMGVWHAMGRLQPFGPYGRRDKRGGQERGLFDRAGEREILTFEGRFGRGGY